MSVSRFVYFAQISDDNGLIKIGVSTNIEQRLNVLKSWLPYDYVLLAKTSGGYDLERRAHGALLEHRFKGEWFHPAKPVLGAIAAINAGADGYDLFPAFNGKIPKEPDGTHSRAWDENLRPVIERLGQSTVARRLGVSRQAINQWTQCPPKHVLTLEAMSGVPRHHIRPDIYPAPEQDGEAA